jgi:integrase
MCAMYLKTKGRLAAATLSQYGNALEFWKAQLGGDRPIDELTHGIIAQVVGSYPWSSAKLTYLKTPEIFENPVTHKPWHDDRSQRDHYWQPALKRLGIRMRRPYQTRHTYATTALMAGVNPSYISRQMGHRSPKMLFSVYAKWIDTADRGREKAKMEAALEHAAATSERKTSV